MWQGTGRTYDSHVPRSNSHVRLGDRCHIRDPEKRASHHGTANQRGTVMEKGAGHLAGAGLPFADDEHGGQAQFRADQ